MEIKKKAKSYAQTMMKELKEMYDGKYKSPMQLPADEKKKFFNHMDKMWKSKKESSTDKVALSDKDKLEKSYEFVMEKGDFVNGYYCEEWFLGYLLEKSDELIDAIKNSHNYEISNKTKKSLEELEAYRKLCRKNRRPKEPKYKKDKKESTLEEKVADLVQEKLALFGRKRPPKHFRDTFVSGKIPEASDYKPIEKLALDILRACSMNDRVLGTEARIKKRYDRKKGHGSWYIIEVKSNHGKFEILVYHIEDSEVFIMCNRRDFDNDELKRIGEMITNRIADRVRDAGGSNINTHEEWFENDYDSKNYRD